MKIFLLLSLFFSMKLNAANCPMLYLNCQAGGQISYTPPGGCQTCVRACPPGTYIISGYAGGVSCMSQFPARNHDCITCNQNYPSHYYPPTQAMYPTGWNPFVPWWAAQGQMYYPNFYYPGAWYNRGIQGHHYHGEGGVMAMKPNIYVKSKSPKNQPFEIHFTSENKMEFLATTPRLKEFKWSGEVSLDKFSVNKVNYDYLFYDARFSHKKMQFEQGICLKKEDLVSQMLNDLKRMEFTEDSQKDFKEHWSLKIPSFPYYCLYPQYNKQLDEVSPLKITPVDAKLMRVLYVLVPYKNAPKALASHFPPLPIRIPASQKPISEAEASMVFMEWGVAFLEDKFLK